ncbi:hypothetical protein H4219_005893 [Mycoemilia scoparia]|uniref:FHA domain-containing protein n=1 Tax=Mycoemilia scoparia TaxID=417184 RepID=A0A9W8DIY1_9FUNG|nr:hypothetical protein H4219_005893 [Mycoemilia scoparia]
MATTTGRRRNGRVLASGCYYADSHPKNNNPLATKVIYGDYGQTLLIGRGKACHITLPSHLNCISRVHAEISPNNSSSVDSDGFSAKILGLNGIKIDGTLYTRNTVANLSDGSVLDFVGMKFQFREPQLTHPRALLFEQDSKSSTVPEGLGPNQKRFGLGMYDGQIPPSSPPPMFMNDDGQHMGDFRPLSPLDDTHMMALRLDAEDMEEIDVCTIDPTSHGIKQEPKLDAKETKSPQKIIKKSLPRKKTTATSPVLDSEMTLVSSPKIERTIKRRHSITDDDNSNSENHDADELESLVEDEDAQDRYTSELSELIGPIHPHTPTKHTTTASRTTGSSPSPIQSGSSKKKLDRSEEEKKWRYTAPTNPLPVSIPPHTSLQELIIECMVFSSRTSLTVTDIISSLKSSNPSLFLRPASENPKTTATAFPSPSAITKIWRSHIIHTLYNTPCFGHVARNVKDASNKQVEDQWHYDASLDTNADRRDTYQGIVRTARRCTLKDKQYYFKPPPKLPAHRRYKDRIHPATTTTNSNNGSHKENISNSNNFRAKLAQRELSPSKVINVGSGGGKKRVNKVRKLA